MLTLMAARNGRQLPDLYCKEKFLISMSASKNLIFFRFHPVCLNFLIQNLAWLGSNISRRSSEGTSLSAPESPIIGLIENPSVSTPSPETTEISNKPNPEVFGHTHAAAEGISNVAGPSSSGSKGPAVRLVPFESMPQSA